MIPLSIQQLLNHFTQKNCAFDFVKGSNVSDKITFHRVVTDSRVDCAKGLFVALDGDNFDGHDFIDTAESKGAVALLVSKKVSSKLPQIIIENTTHGLGLIANLVRTLVNPKVIAITGSAGKTSVKEMLANILKLHAGSEKVLATEGNFNNEIGVPLTLLNLKPEHKFAIVEMGANHQGEIARCSLIADQSIAAINNIAPAHIEGFGSIEGVAKAKSEIFAYLKESDVAVINSDGDFAEFLTRSVKSSLLTVSEKNNEKKASFTTTNPSLDVNGCMSFELVSDLKKVAVTLKNPGKHQVANALVAAALASAAGVELKTIQQGLELNSSVKGRLQSFAGINGSLIIDDTYNASVISVKAAIDYVASLNGVSILVLSDMAELGASSVDYHREIGEYAAEKNINELHVIGHFVQETLKAYGENGCYYDNKLALIDSIKSKITAQHKVLIKGARSGKMEEVVKALVATGNHQDEQQNTLGGGLKC